MALSGEGRAESAAHSTRPVGPRTWRRHVRLLVLAGVVLALGVFFVWPWVQEHRNRNQGLAMAQQGRFADAEPLLRRALKRDAGDLAVVKALALGHSGARRLTEAEVALSRWCELQPDQVEPYKRRMEVRVRLGRNEEATADGQRVLELVPDDTDTCQKVAWLLLAADRPEDAGEACRRCLEHHPQDPQLLYLLAESHHAQGAGAEAEAILGPLVRDHPGFTVALMLRALLFCDAGQYREAIPLLRKVIALDPQRQQTARYHLSLALARTGQEEEARKVMAEVQWAQAAKRLAGDGHPDNLELQVRVAEAQLGAGRSEEALRLLEAVLARDPDYAAAHRLLASYYEEQGQAARATEHRCRAER